MPSRKKATKFLAILIPFLICNFFFSQAGIESYNIKIYPKGEGGFGSYIYTIIQDQDGYLWVGSSDGLHQYDGKKIVNLNSKDSTISNMVTASVVPKNKGLIIGYLKGGLSRFKDGQYQEIFTKGDVSNKLVKIEENQNGTVWVLTQNEGMIRLKGNDYRLLGRSLLKNKTAFDFEIFEDNLFLATNVGLIHYKIDTNDKLKFISMVKGTEHIKILTLFTDQLRSPHSLWIGSEEHGLFSLKLNDLRFEAQKLHILKDLSIVTIAEDDFDNLWVGTRLNGLIKIDFNAGNKRGLQYTYFNKKNGFPGNQIQRVYVDRENDIWVGTFGTGLVQMTEKNIQQHELDNRIQTGGVNEISQLNHTNLVLATDNGLIQTYHIKDLDSLNFKYSRHLRGEKITSVFHSKFNRIWVGTDKTGVYKFSVDLETMEKIDVGKIDGIIESVRYLTEDLEGNLWISIKGNGVKKINYNSGEIEHFNTRNQFYHNEIFHIFPDSQGRIWFGARTVGIALMDKDGNIANLTQRKEIPVKDVNAITEDQLGNIWIATSGQGILKVTGDSLSRYYKKDGLLSDYCSSIAVDKENHIWVSHREGISNINVETNFLQSFNHKSEMGESQVLINSTFTDDVGDIWFGNPFGLTKIDKPHLNFKIKNLKSIITSIRIQYREEDLTQFSESDSLQGFIPYELNFPHDKNDLSFDFIAIHLKDPNAIHYQFMLKGYDKGWSPIKLINEANYTNLPPGKYQFLVKESDNPNYWKKDTASISFNISKAYWNTLWFAASELAVMFFIMAGTIFLSEKIENDLITQIMIFVCIFIIFEYIHTQLEPYLDEMAGGPVIFKVFLNLILALILFPIESIIQKFLAKKRLKKEKLEQDKVLADSAN